MRNLTLPLTFVAGLALSAAIAWCLWPVTPLHVPAASPSLPSAPASLAETPVLTSSPQSEASPPWAGAPISGAPGVVPPATSAVTPSPDRPQNIAQLDAMLDAMQRENGSSVVGGVKIDVLRANLAKAEQLQALAKQIEAESLKPNGGDLQVMQGYLKQLQALQGQLRMDFMAEPAPAAEEP